MSRISERHEKLDQNGEGLCSVPMWSMGCPAGLCDRPAYGERPPGRNYNRWDGSRWRDDGLYAGYVPALACPIHGGPSTRVFLDGNMWCAVNPDFVNLQESPAGFGETPEIARKSLIAEATK